MNQEILFNKEEQQQLDKNGFVVFDFIDQSIVNKFIQDNNLRNLGYINKEYKYQTSAHEKDITKRKNISDKIFNEVQSAFNKKIKNYTIFGSIFANKRAHIESFVSPHNEWSIVDENKYRVYSLWIPLVDITLKNGPMFVLPGSQYGKHYKEIRPINTPCFFDGYDEYIKKNSVPILMKAGQGLMFNQSLIHFSTPNFSTKVRPCIMIAFKDINAKENFIYHKEDQFINKYKVPNDFTYDIKDFINIDISKIKNKQLIEQSIEKKQIAVDKNIFTKMLQSSDIKIKYHYKYIKIYYSYLYIICFIRNKLNKIYKRFSETHFVFT